MRRTLEDRCPKLCGEGGTGALRPFSRHAARTFLCVADGSVGVLHGEAQRESLLDQTDAPTGAADTGRVRCSRHGGWCEGHTIALLRVRVSMYSVPEACARQGDANALKWCQRQGEDGRPPSPVAMEEAQPQGRARKRSLEAHAIQGGHGHHRQGDRVPVRCRHHVCFTGMNRRTFCEDKLGQLVQRSSRDLRRSSRSTSGLLTKFPPSHLFRGRCNGFSCGDAGTDAGTASP
jgi:hypothetical protein